ncbi:recombinase family protein [Mesorhizobium sp. KR9-304]|uniref:recombinase family protein n=1 Tax=Mesorhizobium sp. KR9-304 TaxID=3156614 RepID=UPI0032B55F9E
MSDVIRLRCAVYTRKSTEDGLDQEFNSLDAQREACSAFIVSQASLGWKPVPAAYDDGGISGGTMERPALQRMLQDIRDRKIDVVVVYKIDRLTRSLTDFGKIVEVFDASGVSFVSVTQQFNTTTSMGRLMLNVLLSFAQFEREVTAERIRDKIAASKKKGMWMGGVVPFGYRVESRKLIIEETEASTVRHLFDRYLQLQSVRALADEAAASGLTTRTVRRMDGTQHVTRPFGRGNLYHLLSNPIYVGKIRHRTLVHEGEHQAIIDARLFEAAQALLASQAPRRRSPTNSKGQHLLTGLVYDEAGEKLRSVHANKKGIRYLYYVSRRLTIGTSSSVTDQTTATGGSSSDLKSDSGWRLPANQLDAIVEHQMDCMLANKAQLSEWTRELVAADETGNAMQRAERIRRDWKTDPLTWRKAMIAKVFRRIILKPGCLLLEVDRLALANLMLDRKATAKQAKSPSAKYPVVNIECPMSLRRRGVETRMVLADGSDAKREPDAALVDLIRRAHRYRRQLTDGSGCSLSQIAKHNSTDPSEVSRLLPLAFLAPTITEAILDGSQPAELTALRLSRMADLPLSWREQADLIGK